MTENDNQSVHAKRTAQPTRSWRNYLSGPILFLHMFAFVMSLTTSGLYVPFYISATLFPHRKVSVSTGSICVVNESVASPETETIQKKATEFNIYVSLVSGIPAVIASVFLGAFSDRFGRAIEGSTGGFLALLMAAFSYIADITENNKQRSVAIAFLEIAVGLGLVLGRFCTGYFIKATNFVWPQVAACCIYTVVIMIIVFVLPETRKPKTPTETLSKKMSCVRHVEKIFSFYVSKSAERWKYNICILIFFATGITAVGRSGVDILYQISQPFCWDSVKVGWLGAVIGLFQNVICMGMIKVFHLCLNDEGISILGSISGISGFMITAFASTDVMLYIAAVVGGGAVLTLPMIRAIMSRMTSPDKQGALFGGIAAIETACYIVGSLIFNPIYSHTVSIFRGYVYVVMAGMVFISLILLLVLVLAPRRVSSKYKINDHTVMKDQQIKVNN
ncbi:lysosomal proton-coupled steroid conjugate and bile acid symporter SLC46A3 isoform X2 [Magallana gigas]|uniref:lysosomal proton-coupled steroid conjugate and bile acid symporter SLC46A3 isoform X2 n=1 Tax=Magallana gigas TaxID=29159 RepID=UPI0033401A3E